MVEIFSLDRTKCYGTFRHFKDAKPTLDDLLRAGELSGPAAGVVVESSKGGVPQRSYLVMYRKGWCVPKWPKMQPKSECYGECVPPRPQHTRRKKTDPGNYFRDAMPDWITKPMPVFR